MAESSFLNDFLEKEVPNWGDDEFVRARFKAFSGQKQDWEEKLNFWKDLITEVARHLNLMVIDTESVQQKWFIRDGVVPMGLRHVVMEMKKSGQLETVEQILGGGPSKLQWFSSILKKAIGWAGLNVLTDNLLETEMPTNERLVILAILQARVSEFLRTLAESHHSSYYIATMAKVKELCGESEDAEMVIGYLVKHNKARIMSLAGSDKIEGFKISLDQNPVTFVSEHDHHLLQLQWTMEMLQLRLRTLDSRIALSRHSVSASIKAGKKREALRYVRSVKLLQDSREQCAGYMDKIDQILGIIADAQTSRKVSEAIKVGLTAMKENHVSLEEVNHTLNELDEAIALQRETQEVLGKGPLFAGEVDEDPTLDEELALLEEELEAENLILPGSPKAPMVVEGQPRLQQSEGDPQSAEAELQKDFVKLSLESSQPLPEF